MSPNAAFIDEVGDWWTDVMRRYVAPRISIEECRAGLADAARRVVAEQPPFEPVVRR